MKTNICLLSIALTAITLGSQAQGTRNMLNSRPASIRLHAGQSPKYLINSTYYTADSVMFDQYIYQYGENGKMSTELYQSWNGKNSSWRDNSKTTYTYGDNSMSYTYSTWSTDEWRNASKTEYTYNTAGKKTSSLYYKWDAASEQWANQPYIKDSWVYDGNNRITSFTEQYRNTEANDWNAPSVQILYSYDENGKLTEELLQTRNSGTAAWENDGKYEYIYDEDNNTVTCMSYIPLKGNWIYDGKIICIYDKDNDMERCEYYSNDINASMMAYCVYNYSESMGTAKVADNAEISVYPNPAVTTFELSVPESLVGKNIQIFDAAGKLTRTHTVSDTKTTLSATDMSAGMYFIRIGNATRKLIVR